MNKFSTGNLEYLTSDLEEPYSKLQTVSIKKESFDSGMVVKDYRQQPEANELCFFVVLFTQDVS